ncbi:MAG: PaaI family thioesterase [Acidimicrobiia bacterium]
MREQIAPVFALAPFIQLVGYRLVDAGEGWVETSLDLEERHRQQHGYAHAGVVTTMADHTAGGAASTIVDAGSSVLTAEMGIQLLRPADGAVLTCRGEVVKPGRTLIFAQADVHCDGRHIARLHSTLAVVEQRLG